MEEKIVSFATLKLSQDKISEKIAEKEIFCMRINALHVKRRLKIR